LPARGHLYHGDIKADLSLMLPLCPEGTRDALRWDEGREDGTRDAEDGTRDAKMGRGDETKDCSYKNTRTQEYTNTRTLKHTNT
jgi:hypothetical protein